MHVTFHSCHVISHVIYVTSFHFVSCHFISYMSHHFMSYHILSSCISFLSCIISKIVSFHILVLVISHHVASHQYSVLSFHNHPSTSFISCHTEPYHYISFRIMSFLFHITSCHTEPSTSFHSCHHFDKLWLILINYWF